MGKCMNRAPGGCLVKHGQNYLTGIKLAGGVCDHCEAFVCHGRQVIAAVILGTFCNIFVSHFLQFFGALLKKN